LFTLEILSREKNDLGSSLDTTLSRGLNSGTKYSDVRERSPFKMEAPKGQTALKADAAKLSGKQDLRPRSSGIVHNAVA
jgi:hypothetical protein